MEQFKELTFVVRMQTSGIVCIILGFTCMILGISLEIRECVYTSLFFVLGIICLIIASFYETKTEYSKKFILYIEEKHGKSVELEDYTDLHNEIISLATKDRQILLCYPTKINSILASISSSIHTIEKLNKK